MRGTIYDINERRGMVAILTEDGDFSVFELLGGDSVEIGDEVYWENDTGLGNEALTNVTNKERFEVYFQDHHVPKDLLRKKLLYE